MRLYRAVRLVLLGTGLSANFLAQPAQTQKAKKAPVKKIAAPASRASFDELLAAKDEGLRLLLDRRNAFVCFHTQDDQFLVISFGPDDVDRNVFWDKDPDGGRSFQDAASLTQYIGGIERETGISTLLLGRWRSPSFMPELVAFSAERPPIEGDNRSESIVIDDVEFRVKTEYQNQLNEEVIYAFTLRRSTGRFSETYTILTAANLPHRDEYSGICSIYSEGKEQISSKPSKK